MAFAADLSTLTDALITSVVKVPPAQKGSARIQSLKRRAQGALRTGAHTRTDQFAVAKQLEGLQEKFQVLNRDELAEALQTRVAEVENHRNPWLPEILSLLLQLSDRPALFSTIRPPQEGAKLPEANESLSWSDIRDDRAAFNDEEIWEQVDFGADSSDDDFSSVASDVSLPKRRPQSSTTVEEGYVIPDDIFIPEEDDNVVASIEKAQFWRPQNHHSVSPGKTEASRPITESQLARETIFMLQGLPTSIFRHVDNHISVDHRYTLAHSSNEALASLLQCFGEIGTQLYGVRSFTKITQEIPYMQTFCRGIEDRLLAFDKALSHIQCEYLSPGSTISLLQLLADIRQHSHELSLLSDVICKLDNNSVDQQPMRCLDQLYDLICMLEALGEETSTKSLIQLFFQCFNTYTRSTRLWMETGQVDALDSTFFVKAIRENGDLRTLWHDWFVLDVGDEGQKIPQFLATSVQKVFTAGKSTVFLRHLIALPDSAVSHEGDHTSEPSLLLPFPALVESEFEKIVDADHSLSAGLLRTQLDQQCGLWTSLEALHHVYFGKDMSSTSAIDAKVFDLMDRGRSWDRFLLTEIARTAFQPVPVIDTSKLLVKPLSIAHAHAPTRSVLKLNDISIDYGLPWPVANIITEDAINSYQRISIFLMQIRRAKYSIVKQRIRDARNKPHDTGTSASVLHHNMLWFLDFIYGHFTYFVISSATESLLKWMTSARDVDAMISTHREFISSVEVQCLLSADLSPIHEAIISILDLCIHFADMQTAHSLAGGDQVPQAKYTEKRTKNTDGDSDSDDDYENDEPIHEHTITTPFTDSSYAQQMSMVKHNFEHLTTFVTDSLKGLARADGPVSWDILAERLEWRQK
ncbi:uncharacterized protein N7506_011711 [Penicillium brevicompactum]|uniref:uncharacterized protein n=1 Tax=Penicillium brevicompactum TaxID=5074 RepID=UPI002541096A|nr:uncharacterized protein N7506_011711 [Penicillium brevicompactum]KAJ5319007.1 hypothetical protein N7506_011711 [Penicillium brevicompactum]